jgi:Methyltransferase domain
MTLDTLALKYGTDKSSSFHNYTEIYERYFSNLSQEPIKLLEIGIYEGASVQMWEDYFPNGDLHFIDKDPSIIKYQSQRSHYHYLDQSNRYELLNFISETDGDFDIIIDDGGHRMEQQIISFQMLFSHMKPGGLYIIEDIFTSYWQEYGGKVLEPEHGPQTTIAFLQHLIDEINHIPATTGCADDTKTPQWMRLGFSYYQKAIKALHFHRGLVIIEKSEFE